ncbi:IL-6 subfamily cytokine M17 [Nematolebias whitei]|uniref:IL-6 subfamily cytokine M17 n=1 Tax=Nematolebias whitei TaxID=451745 RepID=UPI00189B1220|nr:IL-6 subfamily cytokine M17 [Nematolebias whitei]
MNGHVKKMHFQQFLETAATLLYFLLLLPANSTRGVAASRNHHCGKDLQPTMKLTKLIQKKTANLTKEYIASQGDGFQQDFCKASMSGIPDPNISGLEPSERIASIHTQLQAFLPHLKQVQEQQGNLQPPKSQLVDQLGRVTKQSGMLANRVEAFYKSLFPNRPLPDPSGGPTTLPSPQNVFQQKVYGCVVLTTYKKLLSNILNERKTLKSKVCRTRKQTNAMNFYR